MQPQSLFVRVASAIAVLGLFVLVATATAQGWRGPGRAKGVVLDPEGKPVVGATVTIEWSENEGGGPKPAKSDDKGRWTFMGLVPGPWRLKIEAEGFQPFDDDIQVYGGSAPETLRATLTPIPKEVLAAEEERKRVEAANTVLQEGNTLAGAGDYAGARVAYEQALQKVDQTKQPEILSAIASTYIQEQKPDEGIKHLEQALAIDPDNVTALRLMVSVLAAQGRDADAEKYLQRLPKEATLDVSTQLNLGIMRYNEGKLEEAGRIFETVLAQNPDRAEAYYFAGLVHLNQQRNDQALERFKKFLQLAPDDARAAEAREFVAHLEKTAKASG
jgi:tetratricopeptide (TPR) repeat protein